MLLAESTSGRFFGTVIMLLFGTFLMICHLVFGPLGIGVYAIMGSVIVLGFFFFVLNPVTRIYGVGNALRYQYTTAFSARDESIPIHSFDEVVLGIIPSGSKFFMGFYKNKSLVRKDDVSNFLNSLEPIQNYIKSINPSIEFKTYKLDTRCDMNGPDFGHLTAYSTSKLVINNEKD